jgi:hypothetical protein
MAINIPIISEFDGKGISKAVQEFKQLETAGEKAQFAIKKAALPAAAALGGLAVAGFQAAKAAMEDEKSAAELARTLKTSTQATNRQVAATEDMIGAMTLATGVADTDLREALATLARGMGSTELASQNLQLAMDISAATGKDLTTVSEALSKAYNGQTTALAKLDPSMRGLVKEGASFNEIGAIMAETFGGAAATAAETAEGRFNRMKVAIGETQESIGTALLPVIEELLPLLEGAAHWVSENEDIVVKLGLAVGGLSVAILTINGVMKAFTAIQTLATAAQVAFNLAVSANPYVIAAAAIIALGTAFVVAYKKVDAFRVIVDEVAGAVKTAFVESWKFIGGQIMSIVNLYRGMFNLIGKAWNSTIGGFGFEIPGWIPRIGGKSFKIPEIPMLADGGIVMGPTLAVVGEAGPEAIIPLDRMNTTGGMGGNVTINVHGGDPQSVVDALRRYNLTNGAIPITIAA